MCSSQNGFTGIQALGTYMGAQGSMAQGQAQGAALQYQAAQAHALAGQQVAAGSANVANTALASQALESRMRAAAGASGVDSVSPTVVNLVSQAAGVMKLNQGMDMYNAQSSANSANNQANADLFAGNQARTAGRLKATGTILAGAASMYSNYA